MPDALRDQVASNSDYNYKTKSIWKSVWQLSSVYNCNSLSDKAVEYINKEYFDYSPKRYVDGLIGELWNKREIAARSEMNQTISRINDLVIDFWNGNIQKKISDDSERIFYMSCMSDEIKYKDDSLCQKLIDGMTPTMNYIYHKREDIMSVKCMLIPSGWDGIRYMLYEELDRILPRDMPRDMYFYHTPFSNRISGFMMHYGIAPNMLYSVAGRMKMCYDADPHQVGLHLVQTAEEDWADLPDLLYH